MNSSERRKAILDLLVSQRRAVKGSELADRFGVSRQVIVQDIAILRASGKNVFATSRGYLHVFKRTASPIARTIATRHHDEESIRDELNIIVDNGGKVIDVIVEHPVYGEIRGNLMVSTRHDVEEFMSKLLSENAEPLCSLTEGLHLHTVETPDEKTFERIVAELDRKGYLPVSD